MLYAYQFSLLTLTSCCKIMHLRAPTTPFIDVNINRCNTLLEITKVNTIPIFTAINILQM